MKKTTSVYEKKAWQLVILCWLAYTTVYVGKKTLSVCLAEMIADGVCDKLTGGTIGTCFLACYAVGQFVNGWLGERVHPRWMICGGLLAAGVMNLLMSVSSSVPLFVVIWAVCGLACSMLWAPLIRAVSAWTTPEIAQASAASLSATIPAGTILCYLICAAALKLSGWRAAFAACGGVLILGAVVYHFWFGSLKDHMTAPSQAPEKQEKSGQESSPKAVRVTVFCAGLVMAAVGILFNGMLKDGLDLWIPTVLNEKFISDGAIVSLICTILPVINLFGAFAAKALLARGHMTELGVCAWMFAASTVALSAVLLLMNLSSGGGIPEAILVTLLLALSSSSMLGANTMLLTYIPLHFGKIGRASAVTGMLNCFSYAAAAVSGIAVGVVSEQGSWNMVFLVFIGAAILGALFCFLGKGLLAKKTRELDNL